MVQLSVVSRNFLTGGQARNLKKIGLVIVRATKIKNNFYFIASNRCLNFVAKMFKKPRAKRGFMPNTILYDRK